MLKITQDDMSLIALQRKVRIEHETISITALFVPG